MNTVSDQVITFGCRLNIYESQIIKNILKEINQKDLVVFNSCAVTSNAEKQLRQAIRKAKKDNPKSKIIVTGCAAQINPNKYAKMVEVDLVLGNMEKSDKSKYNFNLGHKEENNQSKAVNHADQIFKKENLADNPFLSKDETNKIRVNDIMSVKDTAPQLVPHFESQTRAFLEIQNGCNHRCTFCVIPFGRGNSRSVAFGDIVVKAKELIKSGHQEIVFTGVDISDYGKDLPSPISLSKMIKRFLQLLPEVPRLRLSSIDVAELDEEFFDLLENEQRLMPHLHLSIQSGDDLILKRMKRRHSRQQVIDFCQKAQKIRPDITFGADFIAGFPTESEEMFNNSLALIRECNIVFTHIFPYSKRTGTPAAKMPQLDSQIIKQRAKILRETGSKQLKKYLEQQLNKNFAVIIEKNFQGKSENFLDIAIDNKPSTLQSGSLVNLKPYKIQNNILIAKI